MKNFDDLNKIRTIKEIANLHSMTQDKFRQIDKLFLDIDRLQRESNKLLKELKR